MRIDAMRCGPQMPATGRAAHLISHTRCGYRPRSVTVSQLGGWGRIRSESASPYTMTVSAASRAAADACVSKQSKAKQAFPAALFFFRFDSLAWDTGMMIAGTLANVLFFLGFDVNTGRAFPPFVKPKSQWCALRSVPLAVVPARPRNTAHLIHLHTCLFIPQDVCCEFVVARSSHARPPVNDVQRRAPPPVVPVFAGAQTLKHLAALQRF